MNRFRNSTPWPSSKYVIAFGGGKGGVGKTFVTANLAIGMAQAGHSVTIVDLDLGSANLHTCLGARPPHVGLSDFLSGRIPVITNTISETGFPNLKFISGFSDALNIASLSGSAKERLLASLRDIPSSIIMFDLGAGTFENTLDFFLMADQGVLVVVPEPTSIENAYRFMKSAFYRHLRTAEAHLNIRRIIEDAMDHKNRYGIRSPADLVQYVRSVNAPAGERLQTEIKKFKVNLIINQTRTKNDEALGESVRMIAKQYFGIQVQFCGALEYDNAVWQSTRRKKPVLLEFPASNVSSQLMALSKKLAGPLKIKDVV